MSNKTVNKIRKLKADRDGLLARTAVLKDGKYKFRSRAARDRYEILEKSYNHHINKLRQEAESLAD